MTDVSGSSPADPVAVAREVFADAFPIAEHYRELLATLGIEWGLIGPRETDRLWDRHLLNSAAVAEVVPDGAEVVDVGSGAGLPGIPLAIARPDLRVTLLEPALRRVNFLERIVPELGLEERVAVERGRAEEYEGAYDVVTCRAVAPLVKLIPWCADLLGPGGRIVALKGRSAPEEIRAAGKVLAAHRMLADVLSVRAHPEAEVTQVVRIQRG